MGTWGTGLLQDDLALDVRGVFVDQLKAGADIDAATRQVLATFTESLRDSDEAPVVWLVLAHQQWTYGAVSPEALSRVREHVKTGSGLDLWREQGTELLARRQQVLNRFLSTIEHPNPRPKRAPRFIVRAPKFAPGDCLAVKLSDGRYTAALVLAADHSRPEYGMNLIGELNFLSESPPTLNVFKRREWLKLTHNNWRGNRAIDWYLPVGFRLMQNRITLVGNIPLKWRDPKKSKSHTSYRNLGRQIVSQRQQDEKSP
jgi:hypothetical protein